MPVPLRAGMVVLLAASASGLLRAQDSKPADPIAALKSEMALLMTGGPWTEKAVRPIVATLVEKGLLGAAAWWVALAQEAIAAHKLPRTAEAMLKPFAKVCEKDGASPEDKKLAGKIVKAVQAMVASKNFSEAKRWIPLAETLSRVVSDPSLIAIVAKLDSDIGVKVGNQDTTALVAQTKVIDDTRTDLQPMLGRRLDVLLEEYGRAGCRIGRLQLGNAIDGAADLLGQPATTRRLERLFELAPGVEPSQKMTVLIRGVGGYRVLRFGITPKAEAKTVHSAESGPPLVLDVFDGEIVQFSVDNFALVMPGDPRKSYANAVGCEVSGLALGWQRNTASAPGGFAPKLGRVPSVRHSSDPNDRLVKPEWRDLGGVIQWEDGNYQIARKSFAGGFEAEFAKYELGRSWVGGNFDQLTLAVVVPTR